MTDKRRPTHISVQASKKGARSRNRASDKRYHTRELSGTKLTAKANVVLEAYKVVYDAVGHLRGTSGQMECPACKGKLGYSVAASNGHIHMKCENTPKCPVHMIQ